MSRGIRATVAFDRLDVCPVAALAAAAGVAVDSVATSAAPAGERSVTEFATDGPIDEAARDAAPIGVVEVFAHGGGRRYRVSHADADCPCAALGDHGIPVARYVVRDGTLTLDFHAADYDELETVVATLRERFPCVDIRRFVQSPAAGGVADRVLVDRGRLTDRQLEVLERAHEMGYFERPRRANATEVAATLDVAPSTFREHLVAAESKLLEDLLS